ncbi:D-xylose ABC transporter substrate-binding protein [Lichenifustis flavocetrariae]|uniref:D-xylose ABC transporter substrate-binding protein n=1 Tax=Lichenifustis flavocetrariae TaxID=2949735 RepID=A0AA41Z4N7_9HYPH|nr:D-xylose ABC transporter substrate-binding protein [Lichenifustis flavocetrariae]MCW6510240.1 D-xylose ABC transporter substrate-binding protein [Lichenifustis flavocetrariae]
MKRSLAHLLCGVAILAASASLSGVAQASADKPVIGFSIDDLRLERWTRDRDYFVEAAKKLGATVNVQSADASEERQVSQIENMISRGVDAIVIVPFNGKVLDNVINEAKQAGIKVVAYDRLILNSDIDAYVTFDNERVGEMQAQGVLDAKPAGNYFLMGGSPTDNNSQILRAGQMKVLQPAIDAGKVKVVGSQFVPEWSATTALQIMEDALTANKNAIDGVVASNDAEAGGVVQALTAQGLAGKTAVSGQDADLAAIQRVKAGTQTVTVYKPLKSIASTAAEIAVDLSKNKTPTFTSKMDNGKKQVPTILLTPILISKANWDAVVKDGFYTEAQVNGK